MADLALRGRGKVRYAEDNPQDFKEESNTDTFKKGGPVKKGLWYNINKRKKLGISRPKSKSTISPEAYKNMERGFKAAEGGTPAWQGVGRSRKLVFRHGCATAAFVSSAARRAFGSLRTAFLLWRPVRLLSRGL